jgi:hypothetical protein
VPPPHGDRVFNWPSNVLVVGYGITDCEWDDRKREYKALSQFLFPVHAPLVQFPPADFSSVRDFISFLLFCPLAIHAVETPTALL